MLMEPVGMLAMTATASFWPSRMIEPLPNCFSIWPMAISIARARSLLSSAMLPPETLTPRLAECRAQLTRAHRPMSSENRSTNDCKLLRYERLTDMATFAMRSGRGSAHGEDAPAGRT